MPPPLFNDMGRHCAAIFNTGYPLGLFKIDTNIRTCGNLNLNTGCSIKQEDWSLNTAEINSKYTCSPPRIKTSFSESWDLDNNLKVAVVTDDLAGYLPGVKLSGVGSLNPDTGAYTGKINTQAKYNYTSLDLGYDLGDEKQKNVATGSLVAGYSGFMLGFKSNYNVDDGSQSNPTMVAAFCSPTYQVHGFWDNWESYRLSIYHRVHDRLEAGIMASWKPGNPPPAPDASGESAGVGKPASETGTNIAVGFRMLLTPFTFFRAKFDVDSQVGLGIESKLREGTTLIVGTNIDGKSLNGGKHTFGVGIEFEADFSGSGC